VPRIHDEYGSFRHRTVGSTIPYEGVPDEGKSWFRIWPRWATRTVDSLMAQGWSQRAATEAVAELDIFDEAQEMPLTEKRDVFRSFAYGHHIDDTGDKQRIARRAVQLNKVLRAVLEGCRTSTEVEAVTRLPLKHCCSYLRKLEELGKIERCGIVKFRKRDKDLHTHDSIVWRVRAAA